MRNLKSQKGQAIILLAFAMIGLVGFGALAIDGSRVLSDRRHAQNAADTAALAAALEIVHGGNATAVVNAARTRALSNGYDDTSAIQDVTVNRPPVSGPYAGNNEYVQVIIKSTINTTFARVIGRPQVTNVVEAVARAQGVTTNPLVLGAALAAFNKTGTPFNGGGGGDLNVYGSGIYSNSSDTDCPNGSMKLGGSINYHVDTSFASAGSVCTHGGASLDGTQTPNQSQVDAPSFDINPPNFACGGVPASPNPYTSGSELIYKPGTYDKIDPRPTPLNIRLAPGNYCVTGNVTFNQGNVTADGVNIRMTGGAFSISGSTVFTCSNFILHSAGGTGVSITGGTNHCTETTFYMGTGNITLNGNANSVFNAPTSGGYQGLLIYLPTTNASKISINGNSNNEYTGSIIALGSNVTINGNNESAGYNIQVLSDTIDLSGNANINIHYNPDLLYNPPHQPTIELPQ